MTRLLLHGLASVVLLALLYAVIDVRTLISAIRGADYFWLTIGILMIIPLTVVTAWRFTLVVMDGRLGLGEASRLVLAASTLNLFLPSKLGDFAKAYVLSTKHEMSGEVALSIVVFEKALDMASLLLWGVVAVAYVGLSQSGIAIFVLPLILLFAALLMLILPLPAFPRLVRFVAARLPSRPAARLTSFAESSFTLAAWFWRRRMRAVSVVALSIALWGAHLFQFLLFSRAVGGVVPAWDNMAFAALSILVGLVPFTLAGIGSRDVAIVYFYSPYLSPGAAAFLGILATLRYVIPAVAGVPFIGTMIAAAGARRSRTWADATQRSDHG